MNNSENSILNEEYTLKIKTLMTSLHTAMVVYDTLPKCITSVDTMNLKSHLASSINAVHSLAMDFNIDIPKD